MINRVCTNIFSPCFSNHCSRFPLCQNWYVWLVFCTAFSYIFFNNFVSCIPFCLTFLDFNPVKLSINTSQDVRSSIRRKLDFVYELSSLLEQWSWVDVHSIESFFPDRSYDLLLNWLFFYHFDFFDKDFFTFLKTSFQISSCQLTNSMSLWRLTSNIVQSLLIRVWFKVILL